MASTWTLALLQAMDVDCCCGLWTARLLVPLLVPLWHLMVGGSPCTPACMPCGYLITSPCLPVCCSHTTLHHVLHLGDTDKAAAAAAAAGGEALRQQYPGWAACGNVSSAVQWGTSLLAPIAAGRSCDQALVPADNCMCRL